MHMTNGAEKFLSSRNGLKCSFVTIGGNNLRRGTNSPRCCIAVNGGVGLRYANPTYELRVLRASAVIHTEA